MTWLQKLKPSDRAIRELAAHETDARHVRDYSPRAYGFILTVVACAGILLINIPLIVWHIATHLFRPTISQRKGRTP